MVGKEIMGLKIICGMFLMMLFHYMTQNAAYSSKLCFLQLVSSLQFKLQNIWK